MDFKQPAKKTVDVGKLTVQFVLKNNKKYTKTFYGYEHLAVFHPKKIAYIVDADIALHNAIKKIEENKFFQLDDDGLFVRGEQIVEIKIIKRESEMIKSKSEL